MIRSHKQLNRGEQHSCVPVLEVDQLLGEISRRYLVFCQTFSAVSYLDSLLLLQLFKFQAVLPKQNVNPNVAYNKRYSD